MADIQSIAARNTDRSRWIKEKVVDTFSKIFPIVSDKYTVSVSNIQVENVTYSLTEQKDAILQRKTLNEGIYGDLSIVDNATKREVEKLKKFKLVDIPYLTNRLTMVVEGNDYSLVNQLRLKSGVYTRRRENEMVEAFFNMASGKNFRMVLVPETGIFYIEIDNSKIELYPLLRAFGISDEQLYNVWGKELVQRNRDKSGTKNIIAVTKLYYKLFRVKEGEVVNPEQMAPKILTYFEGTKMDADVNKSTLGQAHSKLSVNTLLDASKRILNILQQKENTDDRDNLKYQSIHTVDDAISENIAKTAPELIRKIKYKLDSLHGDKSPGDILPRNMFGGSIKKFITTTSIAAPLPQINPLDIIGSAFEVTHLGPGAIQDIRAVRNSTRQVNSSHMGIIDPVNTKENEKAGVALFTTYNSYKDKGGNIYTSLHNVRTNKEEMVSASELESKIVAFPNQDITKPGAMVEVLFQGKVQKLPASRVQYQIINSSDLFSMQTNLLPFMGSLAGGRALMGAKHLTHSLPIKDREEPLVQVAYPHPIYDTSEKRVASMFLPKALADGTVTKITKDTIVVTDKDGNKHEDTYETNFPLNQKTFLHTEPTVKVGDKVKKGQLIGESIYTKNHNLALGINLNTAFISHEGMNSNDGIVISEGAAKKLTSLHMSKFMHNIDENHEIGKDKFVARFPGKYSSEQLKNIEPNGVVKQGSIVHEGDPLILGIEITDLSAEESMLGKLHRKLYKPYREDSTTWNENFQGVVTDVSVMNNKIVMLIKSEQPAQLGDKLSQRSASKGVITAILKDEDMYKDAHGNTIDVLLSPVGVVSRQNPSLILESAVAKVAKKLGKPIVIENFTEENNIQFAKDLLKKHGMVDKERIFDPKHNRYIEGIMVGPQYVLKQSNQVSTGFSARNYGNYDSNELPVKGGEEGSKSIGLLEINSLLSHNARNILKEVSTLKGTKNTEFWNAYQRGLPLPAPKTPFTFNKLLGLMIASGIKVVKNNNNMVASPLTDKDILGMSKGEITSPFMVRAKDLKPEEGGLYDNYTTGGLSGTNWSHISLNEPILNPVTKDAVKIIFRLTDIELDEKIKLEGVKGIKKELSQIDLDARLRQLNKLIPTLKYGELDKAVKEYKYLKALKTMHLKPEDAYILHNLPVLPPIMRPIIKLPGSQDLQFHPTNRLYSDIIHNNIAIASMKEDFSPSDMGELRLTLQKSVDALAGMGDSPNAKLVKQGVNGIIRNIAGDIPKTGFFQSKVLNKPQDMSGRGVVIPDPTVNMDQVKLPEEMIWQLYMPMIVKKLVSKGYPIMQAQEMVKAKAPLARQEMMIELSERPVLINRAPSLHKFNIIGAYAIPTDRKIIGISPFAEKGQSLDHDGDCVSGYIYSCFSNYIESIHIKDFPRIESSRVVKENGNEEYDVPENAKVLSYNKTTNTIELAKPTKFSIHKNLDTYEVTTFKTRKLTCSRDKSIFAANLETLIPEETPTEKALGMLIPRMYNQELPTISEINLRDYYTPFHHDIIENNIKLDYDFGWLLGLIIGEGWGTTRKDDTHRKYACIAATEPSVVAKIISKMRELSTREVYIHQQHNQDFYEGKYLSQKLTYGSSDFGEIIPNMLGHGCFNKHLPPFFMSAPKKFKLGLLAGMIDGDGSISKNMTKHRPKPQYTCKYDTSSSRLSEELVSLCCSLDIDATSNEYTGTTHGTHMYCINISSMYITKHTELKFYHVHKNDMFKEMCQYEFLAYDKNDIIPCHRKFLTRLYSAEFMGLEKAHKKELQDFRDYSYLRNMCTKDSNDNFIPRHYIQYMLQFIPRYKLERLPFGKRILKYYDNKSLRWDRIVEVVKLPEKKDLYDLTVPGYDTFVMTNQLVAFDTMQVHVPISDKAVQEAKMMTLPNILFNDKTKTNNLMAGPELDTNFGLHTAVNAKGTGKVHVFDSHEAVLTAYRKGLLNLTDNVAIKK